MKKMDMKKNNYSHKVAVTAYIFQEDKYLLLKRATKPYIWAPPGGRLNKDEDPNMGIIREIKEETDLEVEVLAPVDVWFGNWRGKPLMSIDYLVKIIDGEIKLSEEHSEYRWVSIKELEKGDPIQLDPQLGFQLEDFKKADRLIHILSKTNLS